MRNSSTKCSVVMPVLIVLSVMVTCTAGYFTTVFGYQVQIGPISSEHQYGNVLDEKLAQDITAHATKVATAIVLERLGNKTGVNNLLTEEFEEKLTDILTNGIKKAFKAKASQYLFLNAMLWIAVVRVSIMCVCLVVFLRREKSRVVPFVRSFAAWSTQFLFTVVGIALAGFIHWCLTFFDQNTADIFYTLAVCSVFVLDLWFLANRREEYNANIENTKFQTETRQCIERMRTNNDDRLAEIQRDLKEKSTWSTAPHVATPDVPSSPIVRTKHWTADDVNGSYDDCANAAPGGAH